jgi:hypothetical protein
MPEILDFDEIDLANVDDLFQDERRDKLKTDAAVTDLREIEDLDGNKLHILLR